MQKLYQAFILSTLFFYKKNNSIDNALLILDLDNFSYAYFKENVDYIFNRYGFQLFMDDKMEFLRLLLQFNDPNKIETFLAKKVEID